MPGKCSLCCCCLPCYLQMLHVSKERVSKNVTAAAVVMKSGNPQADIIDCGLPSRADSMVACCSCSETTAQGWAQRPRSTQEALRQEWSLAAPPPPSALPRQLLLSQRCCTRILIMWFLCVGSSRPSQSLRLVL